MALSSLKSSSSRDSLSSLLSLSGYGLLSPIIYTKEEEDELQFQRERRREIQFTLDKLEGRITANSNHDFQSVDFEDPQLKDVCGLMSMLGDNLIDNAIVGPEDEADLFEDLTGSNSGGWVDTYEEEPDHLYKGELVNPFDEGSAHPLGPHGYTYLDFNNNSESGGVISMVTGGQPAVLSDDITHPAFSWTSKSDDRFETSSRISEDSLFDDHMRLPPQPRPMKTPYETLEHDSPTGVKTLPPYRDSLCSKIVGEFWPEGSTRPVSTYIDDLGTAKARKSAQEEETISIFYAESGEEGTVVDQTQIASHDKRSFMKRAIKVIAHPMKMLKPRNRNPVNNINEEPVSTSENEKPLGKHSGNFDVASSRDSGTSFGRKVVFSDTFGYHMFRDDPPCVGNQ